MKVISINDKKPHTGEYILYISNHGLVKAMYRNYQDGVGWVLLENGGIDCFDEWLQC